MQQNIFLVGLMGAGKTTVGRLLAKRLGMRFVDSDHEIEARTGATISWIFEIEGEESFRRREVETIRDLTGRSGVVLATGGGAVIHPENRKHLKARGTVIYLRASVNNILQRTMHDKSRPLLQTENRKEKLEELARQRDPLYREVADIIVDTGRPNVHAMVQSIMAQLANYQKGQTAPETVAVHPGPEPLRFSGQRHHGAADIPSHHRCQQQKQHKGHNIRSAHRFRHEFSAYDFRGAACQSLDISHDFRHRACRGGDTYAQRQA